MPQDQGELDATLFIEDNKENIISNIASSWVYEKLVTNVRLSGKITDTKIEYSHLYSTSSLLPHWDTIHATGSALISHSSRNQQPTRPSPSSSSNLMVTNYKPPRLTDKQSNGCSTTGPRSHGSGRRPGFVAGVRSRNTTPTGPRLLIDVAQAHTPTTRLPPRP